VFRISADALGAAVITNRNPKEWFKALDQMRTDEPPSRSTSRHTVNVPEQHKERLPELSTLHLTEQTKTPPPG